MGIIGAGRIGQRIAQICLGGDGCDIGFVDPYAPAEVATGMGAKIFAHVDELFSWADNVLVAAPLTPETKMLISASTLKLLGAEGSLVCASRGGIVDEVALAEACATVSSAVPPSTCMSPNLRRRAQSSPRTSGSRATRAWSG